MTRPTLPSSPPILILANWPDEASARAAATALLDAGLAACVNLLPPVTSLYTWAGTRETAQEIPMFIKSFAHLYPEVERLIQAQHPYAVPEILSLPIHQALPAYLAWMAQVTHGRPDAD